MAEHGNDHLVVFGYSQSAVIANVEKRKSFEQPNESAFAGFLSLRKENLTCRTNRRDHHRVGIPIHPVHLASDYTGGAGRGRPRSSLSLC
jgi:hypothetical protein